MIWRPHSILKPPTDEELVMMETDELIELHRVYHEAVENAERDPFRFGFRLPHWQRAEEALHEVNEIVALGGNRCLSPDQLIYDPLTKQSRKVSEIDSDFHVNAWDGQQTVAAPAEKPFRKPQSQIYRVSLDNGEFLDCSKAHLLLTPSGWCDVGSLVIGDALLSAQRGCSPSRHLSTWGRIRLAFLSGASRLIGKALGCLDDYFRGHCQCDEQPQWGEGSFPASTPSPVGVPIHSGSLCSIPHSTWLPSCDSCLPESGGLAYTPCSIHFYTEFDHPPTQDALRRISDQFSGTGYHASCTPCKSAWLRCEDQALLPTHQLSTVGFCLLRSIHGWLQRGIVCFETCRQRILFPPEVKIIGIDYLRDDWVWDFTVPVFHNYVAGGVISHNSGKTQWGAFSVVRAAVENPNAEIFCFAQTSEVSIRQQQSAVWEWLPAEMRTKQTSSGTYISYTKKNGFTDSSLILPNGSQIIFKTYSQYQNNPTILEGAELGSRSPVWHNIGVWVDEYLLGPELINTLRFRLATRDAKMLVTFTPIDGWTEVIKEFLDGAQLIESRDAELLGGEPVPYVQRSKKRNASIHYFHSQDNPFGGYDRIKETLTGRSREEILIRAYGVPMKSQATKFPRFNTAVNVIEPDKVPTSGVTRYHIIDPAGAKNWFMCWIAVDESGTFYVYREYPGVDVGDWAEWKSGKWVPGEGCKGQGFGIRDYVDLIHELEGDEVIFERLIDPRLGAAKYQGAESASSIIEDLNEQEIICIPAPGMEIEDGLQALISKMSWDTSKPLDSVNRPHFYISSDCENIIHALAEYTGDQGLKEAWKDPIDVLRYAAIAGIDHVDGKRMEVTRQGTGGY